MKRLMGRTVQMMGEEFEERCEAIDAEVRNLKASQDDMVTKEDLTEAVTNAIADARAEWMLEIGKHAAAPSVGTSAPTSPVSFAGSGRSIGSMVDREHRTAATMGSLGWDCTEVQVVARAKDALQRAGIPEEDYTGLAPLFRPGGTGSSAELHFATPAKLQIARARVRAANIAFHEGS